MASRIDPVDGLCVPDPRLVDVASIAPIDGSATGSSYTEASPRPGISAPADPLGLLAPRISGAQAAALDLRVVHAGLPGLDGSIELAYRLTGESIDSLRGWNGPNFLNGWAPAYWSDTITRDSFDACVIPSTQEVVLVVGRSPNVDARVFDPTTKTWAAATAPTLVAFGMTTLICLPSTERILYIAARAGEAGESHYSDDKGTTWAPYSSDLFPDDDGPTGGERARAAYLRGQISLMVEDTTAELTQYASKDLGATFRLVETVANFGQSFSVVEARGKIVLGYVRKADGYPCVVVLGSVWDKASDATVVVLESVACGELEIVADPDGTLIAYVSQSAGAVEDLGCWYSLDTGATWTEYDFGAYSTGAVSDYLTNMRGVHTAGQVLLLTNWLASTGNEDGSIGGLIFGGWSTVIADQPQTPLSGKRQKVRLGFGTHATVSTVSWIPIELPHDGPWTRVVATGAVALASPGELTITTTAGLADYQSVLLSAGSTAAALVQVRVDSGGTLTAAEIGFSLTAADNVNDRQITIRATTTGFRIYDVNAAAQVGTDATVDMTAPIQIAVMIHDKGATNLYIWYRSPADTVWTVHAEALALTNDTATPGAVVQMQFGHLSAPAGGTHSSAWQMVNAAGESKFGQDAGTGLNFISKPLTTTPVPIPDGGAGSGSGVPFLSAHAGPGRMAETYEVQPRPDYPISALVPTVEPSPAVGWRSTSTANQEIVFDLGAGSWIGGSMAVLFHRCNFSTATWEYFDGAAWQVAATANLLVGAGLFGTTVGDSVAPSAGVYGYVAENDLAGGTLIYTAAAKARRIVSNSAGVWDPAAGGKQIEIRLADVDGTEPAASTAITIAAPSGVLVVHLATEQRRRYWRVRIPTKTVAEAYFEAGVIMPARIQPFGAASSWGGGFEWIPNAPASRSRAGTTRAVEQGPPAASWSMAWADGLEHWQLRSSSDLDYVGVSGGLPLAVAEDVAYQLRGIQELTKGGELPVVALAAIPSTTTTITDRSLWIYGRLTGSVRVAVPQGDLGTNEIVRLEGIQIEEIV